MYFRAVQLQKKWNFRPTIESWGVWVGGGWKGGDYAQCPFKGKAQMQQDTALLNWSNSRQAICSPFKVQQMLACVQLEERGYNWVPQPYIACYTNKRKYTNFRNLNQTQSNCRMKGYKWKAGKPNDCAKISLPMVSQSHSGVQDTETCLDYFTNYIHRQVGEAPHIHDKNYWRTFSLLLISGTANIWATK